MWSFLMSLMPVLTITDGLYIVTGLINAWLDDGAVNTF
jgi:hypothetical protein